MVCLLASSAAHLGFQATVHAVVYPALADTPTAQWAAAHAAHSRIAPLVGVVYAPLVASTVAVARRDGAVAAWAAAGHSGAVITTLMAAAPTHRALAGGRSDGLLVWLRRVDAARVLCAAAGFVGSVRAARAAGGESA